VGFTSISTPTPLNKLTVFNSSRGPGGRLIKTTPSSDLLPSLLLRLTFLSRPVIPKSSKAILQKHKRRTKEPTGDPSSPLPLSWDLIASPPFLTPQAELLALFLFRALSHTGPPNLIQRIQVPALVSTSTSLYQSQSGECDPPNLSSLSAQADITGDNSSFAERIESGRARAAGTRSLSLSPFAHSHRTAAKTVSEEIQRRDQRDCEAVVL
jgi:hypothetical protein